MLNYAFNSNLEKSKGSREILSKTYSRFLVLKNSGDLLILKSLKESHF